MVVAVVLRVFSRAFCPADFFFRVEVLRELVLLERSFSLVLFRNEHLVGALTVEALVVDTV